MKENPFSLYDILGYLIPGIFVFSTFFMIQTWKADSSYLSVQYLIDSLPALKFEGSVIIVVIAYALGHILSYFSSITVEKYAVWKYDYPSKYLLKIPKVKFKHHFRTVYGFVWGFIICFIALPTVIIDFVLGYWFGFKKFYCKSLNDEIIRLIQYKVTKLRLCLGLNEIDMEDEENHYLVEDHFKIVAHYTFENSKKFQSKFNNYVVMYGFLRTMSLIMNVMTWYFFIHFCIIREFDIKSILIVLTSSIISYLFFMGFMKFFRRNSVRIYMVLAVDKELK